MDKTMGMGEKIAFDQVTCVANSSQKWVIVLLSTENFCGWKK